MAPILTSSWKIIILVSLLEPTSRDHLQLHPLSSQSGRTAQPEALAPTVDQPSLHLPIQMASRGLAAIRALGTRLHLPTYPGCPDPLSNQETSKEQRTGIFKK
ncbi:hypothetical protein EG68_09671 [Paragonimus skrjabini miyazakii]|uniref:Uncharacterized protein n=1 Tax=Paragonimus skrjabini miyazakii TaxID=59628 RepID=A0A8S9YJV8_9TREM|nr:hypothetical protein EG68_09671 [Paragonimus skrjabini miyazakii]